MLAKVTAPGHPARSIDTVMAMIAENCLSTALVVLGESFVRQWCEKVFHRLAEDHGICGFCHNEPFIEALGMCQACHDQAVADDDEADMALFSGGGQ
jgi:hypothetical protein